MGKGRNRDLNIMKKENITFNFNKTINLNSIMPIKKNIDYYNGGITGFILLIIFLIIFLFVFFRFNETGINIFCCYDKQVMAIFTSSFLFLFLLSFYYNIRTANYLLGNNDFLFQMNETNLNFIDSLIDLNRLYFWMNIIIYTIIILHIIYLCITPKNDDNIDFKKENNKNENSDFPQSDINNNTSTNSESYNSNNNSPYNNTNNNNPNNSEVGYNSSDFINNPIN